MDAAADFARDGYMIFRDVINKDLIQEASDHVQWLAAQHPDLRPEQLGQMYVPDEPFWVRLMSDDRLVDIAEQFVGPDIDLIGSHYISKPPYEGQAVLWHQDSAFWPLEPMEVVTLRLAIDNSTPGNGCVRLIPGNHTRQIEAMRANTTVDNVLGVVT